MPKFDVKPLDLSRYQSPMGMGYSLYLLFIVLYYLLYQSPMGMGYFIFVLIAILPTIVYQSPMGMGYKAIPIEKIRKEDLYQSPMGMGYWRNIGGYMYLIFVSISYGYGIQLPKNEKHSSLLHKYQSPMGMGYNKILLCKL